MSSRFHRLAALAAVVAVAGASAAWRAHQRPDAATPRVLRVCADPNNLPFSNARGEGFENRIAQMVAKDFDARLEYTWWSQRRGFIRNTLNAGTCDVIIGVPTSLDMVLRTQPYYRSSYVFVTRPDFGTPPRTFDDPRFARVRVGVQMIGDDGANSPPAMAFARRGIVRNVRGFMIYGNNADSLPQAPIMDAVANDSIDVAVVWGPLAGYYAGRTHAKLQLTPVSPQIELPFLPFVFDIAMGVRRRDTTLRNRLNAALERHTADVERLLDSYGIPRVTATRRSS
ncbi:MAG TPA: quinoprotein dehydrogenase-associated putative ABC transporter substrate-binding protein [Gemmatimonadaceae bacterium]|nr:quinoprotein dehydrogenase-associated putative ABC transporter substrate-binding protein [Gemmatimonadaceae bacterium]